MRLIKQITIAQPWMAKMTFPMLENFVSAVLRNILAEGRDEANTNR